VVPQLETVRVVRAGQRPILLAPVARLLGLVRLLAVSAGPQRSRLAPVVPRRVLLPLVLVVPRDSSLVPVARRQEPARQTVAQRGPYQLRAVSAGQRPRLTPVLWVVQVPACQ